MYTNIILGINKGLPIPKGIHKVKINKAVIKEKNVGKKLRSYLEQINTQENKYKPQNNILNLSKTLSSIPETNDNFISTHSSKSIVDELSINNQDFKPRVKSDTFNNNHVANLLALYRAQDRAWIERLSNFLNKHNNTKKMKKQEENQRLKKDKLNKQEKLQNPDSVIQKQHKDRMKNQQFIANQLISQQKQIEQLNKDNTEQQHIIRLQVDIIQKFKQKQRDYEEQIKKLLNTNKFITNVNRHILDKDLPYKQDYNKRVLKKINKEYNLFNTTNYSQTNPDFCSTI